MSRILQFEADRRTINITINSFGTELSKEQRARLYPAMGRLFPDGNNALAKADDPEQVKLVCESVVPEYRGFFDSSGPRANGAPAEDSLTSGAYAAALENHFFQMEVNLNKHSFLQQFQHSVFYSYIKLKEHEIRSIGWIAECIAQNARDRINDFIPIF